MRKVKLEILNSTYELKTDVPENDLKKIMALLNKKIENINKNAGTLSTNKLAILTILHFASEHYFVNKKLDEMIKKINNILR